MLQTRKGCALMTLDEAMAKVSAALDEIYADALDNAADMIKRHGATREP